MKRSLFLFLIVLISCDSKDKYDPSKYYDAIGQAEILSGIVTYIFSAPPYTQMKDRFKPEHKVFYRQTSARLFKLDRLFIDSNDRNYYLLMRPGRTPSDKRAAGGYFDLNDNKEFKNFHETFVTPILPDSIAFVRGRFLFDQMVKHDLEKYLKMESYVQWPNQVSHYDTTIHEWRTILSGADEIDSVRSDTTRKN